MSRSWLLAFVIAALAGAAIWLLSPWLTGQGEPWDAGLYYSGALLAAGLVSGFVAPKPLWAHYLGGVFGQGLYLLLFLPPSPLTAVGLAFLLVWTLLLLVGAWAGARLHARRAPA